MAQKIRIKLKSFDYNLVDKSSDKIVKAVRTTGAIVSGCLLYTSPSPRDLSTSRMPSSA